MIIPSERDESRDKYNAMNQFVFFHSIDKKRKVREAMMNEALDCGFLPMKPFFHYSIVDIFTDDVGDTRMIVHNFKNDSESFKEFMKNTKSRDLIMFSYLPSETNDSLLQIIPETGTPFAQAYGFIGHAMVPYHDPIRSALQALGVNFYKENTEHEQKEVFLADLACTDAIATKQLMNTRTSVDFIVLKFDSEIDKEGETKTVLERLFLGSNNNRLRVYGNNKFLYATCIYDSDAGRRKTRGGKIMGGNVIYIDFYGDHGSEILVYNPVFIRPHSLAQLDEYEVATGKELRLEKREEWWKLMFYDKELKTFKNKDNADSDFGFKPPKRITVEDIAEANRSYLGNEDYERYAPPVRGARGYMVPVNEGKDVEVVIIRSKK